LIDPIEAWFAQQGWQPFGFQREVWRACSAGRSGLLHAETGAGKTYAVWLGALAAAPWAGAQAPPLRVLWLTPMRALAQDTGRALEQAVQGLGLPWTVGVRTGDTPSGDRAKQDRRLPSALVSTPESVSLLLARADARTLLGHVRFVIVDEWHELLGNKRGVQTQLAIARLRRWQPALQVWGLSATLANLEHARDVLLGVGQEGVLVHGDVPRQIAADTLIPEDVERFPWAGHMGTRLLPQVLREIEQAGSTLLFTNTRSQAENWYHAILDARPEWAGEIGLHHGSLDHALRTFVETELKEGRLRAVVCTSSLDLGVDFLPVERVIQLGSPKGVARLLQRAGRSGHAPGRVSRATCAPTHSFELLEAAAARRAIAARRIEARRAPEQPMDVLLQHLVTVALGGGFRAGELLAEVRTAWSYRALDAQSWQWALDFVTRGGQALNAYPEYRKVVVEPDGTHHVPDRLIAKRHRMSVGVVSRMNGSSAADMRSSWAGRS
jgi:ATP-dependent Lhr-like helicase